MLSLLPTELLRQIIESTVPRTFHSQTYDERQATLCHLSLVCRRFRQIAQPLLREVVRLPDALYGSDGPGAAEQILREAGLQGWDRDVRQLLLRAQEDTYKSVITLHQVVLACPRLVELAIKGGPRVLKQSEILALGRLSRLRSLQMNTYNLIGVRLPVLQVLTLTVPSYEKIGHLRCLLTPSMLPALLVLAFDHFASADLLDLLDNQPSVQLLQQVDALFVNSLVFSDEVLREMQPFLSKTLAHMDYVQPSTCQRLASSILHLRQHVNASDESLAKGIEDAKPLRLQTLSLNVSLRAPSHPFDATARLKLLNICNMHKIKVVYDQQPRHWGLDSYISQEFWRRQRELKRLEAVQ